MPKKYLKRFSDGQKTMANHKKLRFLGKLLEDPNLFHLNKHSVSRAFFVGIFCAFTPILGQMPLAAILAIKLRCNLPLAVSLVWISNPLTIPPIFLATYKFGAWILDVPPKPFSIELSWQWFSTALSNIWEPLFLGSFIIALTLSTSGYFIVRILWRYQVIREWRNRRLKKRSNKPL